MKLSQSYLMGRVGLFALIVAVFTGCSSSGRVGVAGINAGFSLDGLVVNSSGGLGYLASDRIEATGYAVIQSQAGEPAQQRLMAIKAARFDAYRQLTEIVFGVYIDSSTTIADLTIASDDFRSRIEGVIYGAELVKIEPVSGDTYAVTLALPNSTIGDLRALYLDQLALGAG